MNKKTLGLSGLALLVGLGFSGCAKNVEKYNINGKKIVLEQRNGLINISKLIINDSIEIYDSNKDGVIGNEYDWVKKNDFKIGLWQDHLTLKYFFILPSKKNREYLQDAQEEIKLKLNEANTLYQKTMQEIDSVKVKQIREMKLN